MCHGCLFGARFEPRCTYRFDSLYRTMVLMTDRRVSRKAWGWVMSERNKSSGTSGPDLPCEAVWGPDIPRGRVHTSISTRARESLRKAHMTLCWFHHAEHGMPLSASYHAR